LRQVTEKTCQKCFMKERCWQKEFAKTYTLMEGLKDSLSEGRSPSQYLINQFGNYCVKSKQVIETMKEEMSLFSAKQKLKKQVTESKRLVAEQLQGVSEVMDDFAKEIMKKPKHHEKQELEIIQALKKIGIEIENLEIYQLEK